MLVSRRRRPKCPDRHRVTVLRTLPGRPSDLIARSSSICRRGPTLARRRIAAKQPARSEDRPRDRRTVRNTACLASKTAARSPQEPTKGGIGCWPGLGSANLHRRRTIRWRRSRVSRPHRRELRPCIILTTLPAHLHMVTPRATPLLGDHRDHGSYDSGEPPSDHR